MNENFDGDGVMDFLRYLRKEARGKILLLWDNETILRGKDVKAFLWEARKRLKTRRFPAYAPEINPGELVWSALKFPRLPNFCPKTEVEIREGVERELRWLQRHLRLRGLVPPARGDSSRKVRGHLFRARGNKRNEKAVRPGETTQ